MRASCGVPFRHDDLRRGVCKAGRPADDIKDMADIIRKLVTPPGDLAIRAHQYQALFIKLMCCRIIDLDRPERERARRSCFFECLCIRAIAEAEEHEVESEFVDDGNAIAQPDMRCSRSRATTRRPTV